MDASEVTWIFRVVWRYWFARPALYRVRYQHDNNLADDDRLSVLLSAGSAAEVQAFATSRAASGCIFQSPNLGIALPEVLPSIPATGFPSRDLRIQGLCYPLRLRPLCQPVLPDVYVLLESDHFFAAELQFPADQRVRQSSSNHFAKPAVKLDEQLFPFAGSHAIVAVLLVYVLGRFPYSREFGFSQAARRFYGGCELVDVTDNP